MSYLRCGEMRRTACGCTDTGAEPRSLSERRHHLAPVLGDARHPQAPGGADRTRQLPQLPPQGCMAQLVWISWQGVAAETDWNEEKGVIYDLGTDGVFQQTPPPPSLKMLHRPPS